ncbi:MAG: N-acetyl-gamma-glutamyl-phosphate reductase [Hyphomicrobiales bacterium]
MTQSLAKIFIDGEAGTTGLQIRERLASRSDIELISLDDDRRKDAGARAEALNAADVAILCLPDAAAREAVSLVTNPATRVIDASTAFRTAPGWDYGFPEMTPDHAATLAASKRISNPGCFPTGTIAMVRPLIEAGLLPADYPVTVNAVSGYSGGGKSMIAEYEKTANPVTNPYRPYGLEFEHKHVDEMQVHGRLTHRPLFQPAVAPYRQGMIVSVPLQLWALDTVPTGTMIHECLAERYNQLEFVEVSPLLQTGALPQIDPRALNGSNMLRIHVFINDNRHQAVLSAVYDNLGKGASGAAVQNLNLLLGTSAGAGLKAA